MKYLFAFLLSLTLATPAFAAEMSARIDGPSVLSKDVAGDYTLTLADATGKPITVEGLREVHESKVHFLVIDESMTDYQHLHPKAAGEGFTFSFTPKTAHDYMAWADVTLKGGHHAYLPLTLKGTEACAAPCIDTTPHLEGMADGIKGTLSFDAPLKAGAATMASLKLSDAAGKPIKDLEPVMGAMAHVVGFYTAKKEVLHLHPMGMDDDLDFHLEPDTSGPLKLFAQVRRGGHDIFIPFTVTVE